MIAIPTSGVYDLWDNKTLNIVANSTEYLRLTPRHENTLEPYNLEDFNTIEWRLGRFGALGNHALISKKLVYSVGIDKYPIQDAYKYFKNGQFVDLVDSEGIISLSMCDILILGKADNAEIQIEIRSEETKDLVGGGYFHQIILSNMTDDGKVVTESFTPFQGVLIVDKNIISPFGDE